MSQRGGDVVRRRLEHVPPIPIKPLLHATSAPGTCVDTDASDIYSRLDPWSDE
jgi:transposase